MEKGNLLYIQSSGFPVLSNIPRPSYHQNFSRIVCSKVHSPGKLPIDHFFVIYDNSDKRLI